MMPAALLDTRNRLHRSCWLSAGSAKACLAKSDASAFRTQTRQLSSRKMLTAHSYYRPGSSNTAIRAALPVRFKTHALEPAAKSP